MKKTTQKKHQVGGLHYKVLNKLLTSKEKLRICPTSPIISLIYASTSGGLGIFPFSPIEVSPIGLKNFLSERGIKVLKSEF